MPSSPRSASTEQIIPATATRPEILVVRSARRRKTVSARPEGPNRVRLMVPASSTGKDIEGYIQKLVPAILAQQEQRKARQQTRLGDDYLHTRADYLLSTFLSESLPASFVPPETIRWVSNQNPRWGSATPSRGSIRISHLIQNAPEYVIDFVLHHELCHFIELNHTARFRVLESLYPRKAEAEAFLEGFILGQKNPSERSSS